ncbi:MAG: PGPGW domain-containing protein [Candidatus Binataceae bacterium]
MNWIIRNLKQMKRLLIFVAGITVLILGIVMLVVPGPGLLTVALGLGILATEFFWAQRLLGYVRHAGRKIAGRLFGRRSTGSRARPGGRWRGRGYRAPHYIRAPSTQT